MSGARRAVASELVGTALLLATIVGSGIMGSALSPNNQAIALLANAAATASVLYVLITLLAPVSGAHFNPAVSVAMCVRGRLPLRLLAAYVVAQVAGAIAGVLLAHAMFGQPLLQSGVQARTGAAQWLSEGVATFGLLATILLAQRERPARIAALVASWIFAAYWFTASTSFANPAVTLARALTQSFSGIRPLDGVAFALAQLVGAMLAVGSVRTLRLEYAATTSRGPTANARQ